MKLVVKRSKPSAIQGRRTAFLYEYYDIWRCYYDGSCPSTAQRDEALMELKRLYPEQEEPV